MEKPRIIPESGNKPQIISAAAGERKPKIWLPTLGDLSPSAASDFVTRYREFAGLKATHGFMSLDLNRMVESSMAAPLRFVYETRAKTPEGDVGHWMLYIRTISPDRLRVYDPVMGIKDLTQREGVHAFRDVMFNDPSAEAQWGPETAEQRGKITVIHKKLLNPPAEAEYQINENALVKLGPIQKNPYDCGPLCVYAGIVARKTQ